MSFFKGISRAFGFSSGDEEEYYCDDVESVAVGDNMQSDNGRSEDENLKKEGSNTAENVMSEELPLTIFDSVLEVFNSTQPDFIKNCLNIEAQRQYIYSSLDASLKKYINNAIEHARLESNRKVADERERMHNEMEQLRIKNREAEELHSQMKQQQLSADRQKRALSDRIKDLEKQVLALEAEREQFQLENKSLVNKVKVAGVYENDVNAMRQEMETLRRQLSEAKDELEQMKKTNRSDAHEQNVAGELRDVIQQMQSAEVEKNAEIETLKIRVKELESEKTQYESLVDKRMQTSDAMLNELNNKSIRLSKELEEKDAIISEKEKANQNVSDALSQMEAKMRMLSEELEACQTELDEANASLKIAEEVQVQVERFEEIINKKDSRIATLQNDNKDQVMKLASLEQQVASLKQTIENNLYLQANSESELRKEIEQLREAKQQAEARAEQVSDNKPRRKRRQEVKISAIDDTFDDTDWLVSTPPEGVSARPASPTNDAEFGYQEPPRRQTPPENAAQMSLW